VDLPRPHHGVRRLLVVVTVAGLASQAGHLAESTARMVMSPPPAAGSNLLSP
jgi:hypothetical protein